MQRFNGHIAVGLFHNFLMVLSEISVALDRLFG